MSDQKDIIKIPLFLKNAPQSKKNAYIEWKTLANQVDNHPHATYVHYEESIDKEVVINTKSPPHQWHKRAPSLPKEKYEELKDIYYNTFKPIWAKMAQLKSLWDDSAGLRNAKKGATGEITQLVVEMIGKYMNQAEVRQELIENHGYNATLNQISRIKQANKDKIEALRAEWTGDISDIHLTHKRSRIEQLCWLAKTQAQKYKDNDYSVTYSRELRAIMDQIRNEVEGQRISLDVNGNININATLTMNMTIQQLMSKISVNNLVLAMTAAKRGLDPTHFMNQLTASYYRDFNGFNQNISRNSDPDYPSELISQYDWNAIELMHKDSKIQDIEVLEEETSTDEQVATKSKLVALMEAKRKSTNVTI